MAPGRPTAARETCRRNRARTTIFAITAGKNYAHRLSDLGLARERVKGKQVEVIPNTSPTHSCCIVKVTRIDSAELKVQRASIALCTLAPYQTPFKEERRVWREYSTSSHYGIAAAMDSANKAKPLKSLAGLQ